LKKANNRIAPEIIARWYSSITIRLTKTVMVATKKVKKERSSPREENLNTRSATTAIMELMITVCIALYF
jgi:hypothetical protein